MHKHNRLNPKKAGILGTVFGGLLVGIPAIPFVASAQTSQVLNPCPGIYYEEPFNSTRVVPEGCPPNEATEIRGATRLGTTDPITLNQQPSDNVAGQSIPTPPGANRTPNRIVPADAPTTPATVTPRAGETPLPGATAADPTYSPRLRDQTNPPVTPPLPENRSQPVANVMLVNGNVDVKVKNNTNAIVTYEAIGYTQRRYLPGGEETVLRNLPVPVTVTFVRQDEGLVKVMPMTADKDGMLEVSLDEDKSLDDNQGVLRIQKDGQVFLN